MALRPACALAAAIAALSAASAFADPPPLKSAGDAVRGHPGLTYADLVRRAVPDLAPSADNQFQGHFKKPPRHLAGEEFQGDPSEPAVLGLIEDKRILVGGKKRIALLADLGGKEGRIEGLALLMLFDDTGSSPKLLDAADVGIDKDTAFADQAMLPLGPGDAALVTWSEHDDADLTMGGYMLVSPVGDQFAMVARIELTSEKLCSWHGIEHAEFATAPDPASPYNQIQATVTAAITHTGAAGCNDELHPAAARHVFQAAWRWNAATRGFEPAPGNTLGGLDALNNKLFGQ
jgi:hypothetical protein